MLPFREWIARLAGMFRRGRTSRRFEDEVRLHREFLVEGYLRDGLSRAEADAAASRELGCISARREEYLDRSGVPVLQNLLTDARFGMRLLRRSAGFATVAVLTIAIGIGGATAMFTLLYNVLLKPLEYPNPERLAVIWGHLRPAGSLSATSMPNYMDLRKANQSFENLAACARRTVNVTSPGFAEALTGSEVSDNFFATIGTPPPIGRTLSAADENAAVVVLAHDVWLQRFGGSTDALGRAIVLDGKPHTVIGVMPRYWSLPTTVQLWTNFGSKARNGDRRSDQLVLIGRLRSGVTVGQAGAEMDGLTAALEKAHPDDNAGRGARVLLWHDDLVKRARAPLVMLFAAVGVLLLIACVNIANMLLARAAVRRREMLVRASLGATGGRLAAQMFIESLLLAVMGGVLGVGTAAAGLKGFQTWAPARCLGPTILS